MYPNKQVLVRPRQAGKSTDALRWVAKGTKCAGYPGWTRVLIVPSLEMEKYMRKMPAPRDIAEQVVRLTDMPAPESWWQCLPDWAHRVYALEEFRNGANGFRPSGETEWCVDDFDLCVSRDIHAMATIITRFKVTRLTFTGAEWTDE